MEKNAIGLIELTSIASGFEVTDAVLKAANVELLVARTVCPGKYIVIIGGDVADVATSVRVGIQMGGAFVVDECVIPNIHEEVFPALSGNVTPPEELDALGVLESFSIAVLLEAADVTVKTAEVHLLQIGLGMAIGGKAYLTLTGDISAVQAAIDAGAKIIAERGMLVYKAVIPAPLWTSYLDIEGMEDIRW